MVDKVVAQLFGDDNIMSIPECGKTFEQIQRVFEDTYGMFGLKFEPFLITRDLEECEFLGFNFKKTDRGWIPRFKLGKLANAFVYQTSIKEDLLATVSRLWSLSIMLAGSGSDVYEKFARATEYVLVKHRDSEIPTVRVYANYGLPTYDEVLSFFLGDESSFEPRLFVETFGMKIHQSSGEEVVRNKVLNFMERKTTTTTVVKQPKKKFTKAEREAYNAKMAMVKKQYIPPRLNPAIPHKNLKVKKNGDMRPVYRTPKFNAHSRLFLTQALDPMHDTPNSNKAGWPDKVTSSSVVRALKLRVPLVKPAGNSNIPDKWDCHIIVNPWMNRLGMEKRARVNNVMDYSPTGDIIPIGGVQAYACSPGTPFTYGDGNLPGSDIPEIAHLEIPTTHSVGEGRLIGCGIEVLNETSLLYVDGDLVAWRAPEPNVQQGLFYKADQSAEPTVYPLDPKTVQFYRYPPATPSQALTYDASEEWKAKDGAYMVCTFNDFENPAMLVGYTSPALISNETAEDITTTYQDVATLNKTDIWTAATIHALAGELQPVDVMPGTKLYPINQCGFILSGLNAQSELMLKFNFTYETFPSIAQLEILDLAKPSSPYDPVALEYLSRVTARMPVAVLASKNASGDWWREVLKMLSAVAPSVGALLGQPALGLAAGAGLSAFSQL